MRIKYNQRTIECPHTPVDGGIASLREYLWQQTSVPVERIKLIFKGVVLKTDGQLLSFDHEKEIITMTGSNADANIVPSITTRIIDDLTTDGKTKLRKKITAKSILFQPSKYGFQRIDTLPNLPDELRAREILIDLAMDEGVVAVCNKYKWTIGSLGELFPNRSSTLLLGLNTNQGQKIELRIRDDELKGFCKRYSLLEVLCHELAHNVHGPHDDKFYKLMRQLEKEVIQLNWKKNTVHSTGGSVAGINYIHDYELNENNEDTKIYVLEGDVSIKNSIPASKASGIFAMSRSQREIEIENSCSTCSSVIKSDKIYCLPSSKQADMIPTQQTKEESLNELTPVPALSISTDDQKAIDGFIPMNDAPSSSSSRPRDVPMTIDADDVILPEPIVQFSSIARDDLTSALIDNIIDEAITLSIGMDANSPVERLQICRAGIYNIINTNNANITLLVELFEFLHLLINNALTMGSKELKYRSIKKSNVKFKRLVIQVNGSMEVLRSVGFNNETQENISLDRYDAALLYLIDSLMESCHLYLSKYRDYRIE